jgi:mRNA-degrading endonuclease RelE of RelBE toxin-antitoxin system
MNRILFTEKSIKSFKKLPKPIQNKAEILFNIVATDYRDSRLKTKKLNTISPLFSFRISQDYRAIFEFINRETIKVLDIKHRKDIYKNIK